MAKKQDKNTEEKLPPDEDLKHENFALAVKGEEIYTRMRMLEDENKKIINKYAFLKGDQGHLLEEFEAHKAQKLVDRQKF